MRQPLQDRIKLAKKKWFDVRDKYSSELNIYQLKTYHSASKIRLEQFLALRTVWVTLTRDQFNPDEWGINDINGAADLLRTKESWPQYLNHVHKVAPDSIHPVPCIGGFEIVWYHQQLVQDLVDLEDYTAPKPDFSPIANRTRNRLKRKRQIERLDTPCPPSREPPRHAAKRKREEEKQRKEKINNGINKYFNNAFAAPSVSKPLPSLNEAAMLNSSFDNDETPAVPSSQRSTQVTGSDPEYAEEGKFPRHQDEQIVNTCLITFANVATFTVPGVKAHWSLQRKGFTFGQGANKLYEARIDGHLYTLANSKKSRVIVEVKKRERFALKAVHMQETAQMAAWISSEPDAHQEASRGSWKGYRRFLVSQNRHEIFLTVAEYDSQYLDYIQNPGYDLDPSLMTMFQFGPWNVSKRTHMNEFAAILLAMTLQLGSE
ncbi:hypothetical protein PRK78_002217 [Emydomyces testavorans]|uniref:Uncharacterized protein n=1 Tax=Emydomyces testavorans TaxID=2070801 RepID=A0AAF0DFP4_9EURO|nr:hypothetical protein PRK78_002217 [Emydomyces testavorans]